MDYKNIIKTILNTDMASTTTTSTITVSTTLVDPTTTIMQTTTLPTKRSTTLTTVVQTTTRTLPKPDKGTEQTSFFYNASKLILLKCFLLLPYV